MSTAVRLAGDVALMCHIAVTLLEFPAVLLHCQKHMHAFIVTFYLVVYSRYNSYRSHIKE